MQWIDMKILTVVPALVAAGVIAAPAVAQSPVLDFSTKGDFVYLDFNPPGSKAPVLKLACTKGVGRITLAQYEAKPADQPVNVVSGAVTGSYGGKKATGSRGDFVTTQLFASEKVMTTFRDSGQLEVSGDGYKDTINAGPNKPAVDKFFAGCEEGAG
jgi:hypothetical protein